MPAGPGVRLDPGRRGSAVLSVIAVAAVIGAATGMFGSGGTVAGPSTVAVVGAPPSGSDVLPSSPSSPPASVDPAAAVATTPPPPAEIVVAVTGAVVRPGIVVLQPGARVADAISAAGGVVDGTDYTGLNLAAKVADGDSVVVGGTAQGLRSSESGGAVTGGAVTSGPGRTSGGAAGARIDLNTADLATLETLPGVGPVMAGNILTWRASHGGFTAVDQLQEVTGIGPSRFATLAPLVRVG